MIAEVLDDAEVAKLKLQKVHEALARL